jgi:tetratricopeptide (TPR) repeat protein
MATANEYQAQGIKLFMQKDYESAARVFQQAADAYETEGKRDMVGEMQTNLGLVHSALGENQLALDQMQLALNTFQEMEDALRAAKVLGNMGRVYSALGDREQAYTCYRSAADVFQEMGENKLYGETLLAMGDLQVKEGKLLAGAATYEVGLENIGQLSASQKILKGLIGMRNKLTGG